MNHTNNNTINQLKKQGQVYIQFARPGTSMDAEVISISLRKKTRSDEFLLVLPRTRDGPNYDSSHNTTNNHNSNNGSTNSSSNRRGGAGGSRSDAHYSGNGSYDRRLGGHAAVPPLMRMLMLMLMLMLMR
jgi:hypothetical protein